MHSPGPWRDVATETINGEPTVWETRNLHGTIAEIWSHDADDARLIAAAPALLAALQDVVGERCSDDDSNGHCVWCGRDLEAAQQFCDGDDCAGQLARAAIAKATG